MNKSEKDKLADAMVDVCVRDFGAKATDSTGDLLWLYFRDRLEEVGRSYVDSYSSAHNELRHDMESQSYTSMTEKVAQLRIRKQAVEDRQAAVEGEL